jgi:hypothetical protein
LSYLLRDSGLYVQPLPGGTARVVFETQEARLAGDAVRFALVEEFGRVAHEGEVRLARVREEQWGGQWTGPVSLANACELWFEVSAEPSEGQEGNRA